MNIKQAKEQIRIAMKAYFTKDQFGNYRISIEKQRPIFLMGPPGIGKTAIMEQIAQELEIGLVTYSMTHHTRQSALGLPFIVHKNYRGLMGIYNLVPNLCKIKSNYLKSDYSYKLLPLHPLSYDEVGKMMKFLYLLMCQ